MYKNNVPNKERKEKDTWYPHYIPKKNNNIPSDTMIPKTNSPPKSDYFHI